jgi:hypothetical protein
MVGKPFRYAPERPTTGKVRLARHPPRIDAKRGDHFLKSRFDYFEGTLQPIQQGES